MGFGSKDSCTGKFSWYIHKFLKVVVILFLSYIFIVSVLSFWRGKGNDKDNNTSKEANQDENRKDYTSKPKATPTLIPAPTKQPKNIFASELKEYEGGEYKYITLEDLEKYHANMDGVKICIITEIDDIDDEKIQSTICEGFMMSNFNTKKNYENTLEDDDIIAIIGEINGYQDYGVMGKSINFDNCMVIALGDDAEKYRKSSTDDSLKEYFSATEETISSGAEVTEEEYKNLCEILKYKDIMRNPDSYEGKMCKVSGEAEQIVEGWFDSITIYVVDANGDKWGCTYVYKDGEDHILEGDSVIIFGECKGTTKVKTVLGKQVILPEVSGEYIEIIE